MNFDLANLNLWIGIVMGLLTILGIVFGWFKKLAIFLARLILKHESSPNIPVPKKTMVLVPDPHEFAQRWSEGKIGDKDAMHVSGSLNVTNISQYGIKAVSIETKCSSCMPMVSMKDPNSNVYGGYMLPTRALSKLTFSFWVSPPVKSKGEPLKASVAIIDQFGNKHWVKDLEFKSL